MVSFQMCLDTEGACVRWGPRRSVALVLVHIMAGIQNDIRCLGILDWRKALSALRVRHLWLFHHECMRITSGTH